MKESYTASKPEECANALEYMMSLSELQQKGPVLLNICNSILKKKVNLDKLHLLETDSTLLKNSENIISEDDNHSLLQYYEKKYEIYDNYDIYEEKEKK